MTAGDGAGSFGPYAFALTPAEAEAAAARFGLRVALRGGLIASHLAPLAIFILAMLFASILALAGFIGRRAAEATILLAAAAFMIQRLAHKPRRLQAADAGAQRQIFLDPVDGARGRGLEKPRGHRDLVTVVGHAAIISAGEWISATRLAASASRRSFGESARRRS